jgi:methionyl aminopeptidase
LDRRYAHQAGPQLSYEGISLNDVVVHGVPRNDILLKEGDLVKVDVCASWQGYCADMARPFFVGAASDSTLKFVATAQASLDKGIEAAIVGAKLTNISSAIQQEVERHGYGVVRDFAGHGIGKKMHEDPEVLNYGAPGKGPVLQQGMAFALEPMITQGMYDVFVDNDNWTVKTKDGSLACHVEDTIIVTYDGPIIITREVR